MSIDAGQQSDGLPDAAILASLEQAEATRTTRSDTSVPTILPTLSNPTGIARVLRGTWMVVRILPWWLSAVWLLLTCGMLIAGFGLAFPVAEPTFTRFSATLGLTVALAAGSTLAGGLIGLALALLTVVRERHAWLWRLPTPGLLLLAFIALALAALALNGPRAGILILVIAGIALVSVVVKARALAERLLAAPFVVSARLRGLHWRKVAARLVAPNLAMRMARPYGETCGLIAVALMLLDLAGLGFMPVIEMAPALYAHMGIVAMLGAATVAVLARYPDFPATAPLVSAYRPLPVARPADQPFVRAWATPVLVVERMSAAIGPRQVLSDISLVLYPRRTLAMLGGDGSGKSVLTRVLVGWLPASRGRQILSGEMLAGSYVCRNQRMLAAMQRLGPYGSDLLDPLTTVESMLALALTPSKGDLPLAQQRRLASELLSSVGLDLARFGPCLARDLTPGQAQHVALALALTTRPQILLCDNVSAGLNAEEASDLVNTLSSVRSKRNLALLFVTDDVACAAAIADDIAVMADGKIVETASTREALTAPLHRETQRLLQHFPRDGTDDSVS